MGYLTISYSASRNSSNIHRFGDSLSHSWGAHSDSYAGRSNASWVSKIDLVRALVVDDETTINELVTTTLRYEGWEVRSAFDGAAALALARDFRPDVVILDVTLPDIDGLAVVRRVHSEQPGLPVLFLSARDGVADRVAGLTAGGDDYVTKPFSVEELVARTRALLRRSAMSGQPASRLVVGDLALDEDTRDVERGGVAIALTPTEFELLRFFMRNPRRILSKAQILDRVWHYDFGGQSNVVELYVSYLRKKIDAGRSPMIHTVRGAGYLFRPGRLG
jgi:two-component system, OmpR family, response regulator